MYTPDWRKPWQLASLLAIALPSLKAMQIPTQVKMMSKSDWKQMSFVSLQFTSKQNIAGIR